MLNADFLDATIFLLFGYVWITNRLNEVFVFAFEFFMSVNWDKTNIDTNVWKSWNQKWMCGYPMIMW